MTPTTSGFVAQVEVKKKDPGDTTIKTVNI